MTKGLEKKIFENLSSLKKNLKKKILPLALGVTLLYGITGCDLYNQYLEYLNYNNVQEEQITPKKNKAVILMNTSEIDKSNEDEYASLKIFYDVLRLNRVGYDSSDIYVLGHDSQKTQFEDYRQLTRTNLENVINEINEKYSEDAFLMIHIVGDAIKEDLNDDGNPDSSYTNLVDEKFYSHEHPEFVYSFLRNERRVLLNVDQDYSGFIHDSFKKNSKDNVLGLFSSGKDEEKDELLFSQNIALLLYDAQTIDSSNFNSDGQINGQETFDYISKNKTSSTPQMWTKDTTKPEDFIIHKYESVL